MVKLASSPINFILLLKPLLYRAPMNLKHTLLSAGIITATTLLTACGSDDDIDTQTEGGAFDFLSEKMINSEGLEGIWQQAIIQSDMTTANNYQLEEKISSKNYIRAEYNADKTQITFNDCQQARTFKVTDTSLELVSPHNRQYTVDIVNDNDLNGYTQLNTTDNNETVSSDSTFRMVKVNAHASSSIAAGSYDLGVNGDTSSSSAVNFTCIQDSIIESTLTENQISKDFKSIEINGVAQNGFAFKITDSAYQDIYSLHSLDTTSIDKTLDASDSVITAINSHAFTSTIRDNDNNVALQLDINLSF